MVASVATDHLTFQTVSHYNVDMKRAADSTGRTDYDYHDPLPGNLAEVEKQIEYWMSRQNEGQAGSDHEVWVANKLDQLRWKEKQLLRPSALPETRPPESALIFLSCGQYTEKEKALGRQVKQLLEQSGAPEVYFADFQNTLDAFTNNILGALNRCIGFIGVMHHRGRVATPNGELVRASVWIEQELAIAAFIEQILNRKIEVQLYIQEGIAREGMRDKLLLNAAPFKADQEVLDHLKDRLSRWSALATISVRPGPAFEETFRYRLTSAKSNFWLRTPRRDGIQGQMRSSTHFWMCLFPVKSAPVDLDVNVSRDFVRMISENFPTDRQLADDQGTAIEPEVTYDKAREFVLPIVSHREERRWRLGPGGEIGFVAQSIWPIAGATGTLWSAYDVAVDALSLFRLASLFMSARSYKGWMRLHAELVIHQAMLATERQTVHVDFADDSPPEPATEFYTFPALFHQRPDSPKRQAALPSGVIIGDASKQARATFETDFAIGLPASDLHKTTAIMLAQLAIGLGCEVDLHKLRASLRAVSSS